MSCSRVDVGRESAYDRSTKTCHHMAPRGDSPGCRYNIYREEPAMPPKQLCISADSHVVESAEFFKPLAKRFGDQAPRVVVADPNRGPQLEVLLPHRLVRRGARRRRGVEGCSRIGSAHGRLPDGREALQAKARAAAARTPATMSGTTAGSYSLALRTADMAAGRTTTRTWNRTSPPSSGS